MLYAFYWFKHSKTFIDPSFVKSVFHRRKTYVVAFLGFIVFSKEFKRIEEVKTVMFKLWKWIIQRCFIVFLVAVTIALWYYPIGLDMQTGEYANQAFDLIQCLNQEFSSHNVKLL